MLKKASLVLIVLLVIPFISNAEMKSFVKEYTYQASEIDSKRSSREQALVQVKRLLLEEIGTYLESHTVVKNYQLTKDQITTFTAGVVKAKIIEEKWDGITYYLKAEIMADPDSIAKSIDNLRTDYQKYKDKTPKVAVDQGVAGYHASEARRIWTVNWGLAYKQYPYKEVRYTAIGPVIERSPFLKVLNALRLDGYTTISKIRDELVHDAMTAPKQSVDDYPELRGYPHLDLNFAAFESKWELLRLEVKAEADALGVPTGTAN